MCPPVRTPAWTTLIASLLAVVVTVAVPALRATAPLIAPAQWTIADLAVEAARAAIPHAASGQGTPGGPPANLQRGLDQARALWHEFHGRSAATSPAAQRRMDAALAAAALIPVLAIVAGLCALLSLLFVWWRRGRWLVGAAIAGAVASAYVIAASWWLTHMVRTELTQVMGTVQQRWGGLITALGGHTLTATLTSAFGLEPQAGLYVLLLAFVAMLVLPDDRFHKAANGSA